MQKFSESLSLNSEDYLKKNPKNSIFSPASEIQEEKSKNEFFKVKLSVETKYDRKKLKEKINPFSFFTPKDEISPSEAEYPGKNYRKSLYPDPSLYISSHLSLARLQLFNLLYPSYSSSSFNPIKPDQILSNSPPFFNPSTFRNPDIIKQPRFNPYPAPPRSSPPPVVRPVPKRLIPLCHDRLSQFTTTLTNPTFPRHLTYDKTTASRHLPDKDSTTPRHLRDKDLTSPRLLAGHETTTPHHLPGHESNTPRHLPSHQSTSPRHLSVNKSTTPHHLPSHQSTSPRHLPVNESTTPRQLPGHESTTPRHLPGHESTTTRHLLGHETTTPRHLLSHESTTPRHLPSNESTTHRHPAAMNPLSLRPYLPPLPPPPGLHFIWEHSFLHKNQHKVNINLLCKHGIRNFLNI